MANRDPDAQDHRNQDPDDRDRERITEPADATSAGVRAVRTTGIYCRPGCAARPDERNVTHYPLAAAAEAAGYRACHRCRPYRADAPGAIGPDLVCRAVRMIAAGGLDYHTESDLASTLGVSARHLRRLFDEHLGVTPDGLARSHRAHFARRLLDDTDLSVADVAFAAGYGSARQLQRAMAGIFGDTPSALRARRPGGGHSSLTAADRHHSAADPGGAGGVTLKLPHVGRLDWDAMATWLGARALEGVETVGPADTGETRQVMRRTLDMDGEAALVTLGEDPDGAGLALTAHLPRWDGLVHTVRNARRVAATATPAVAATRALAADPLLGGTIRRHPGLRPPGCWDPFETTIRAVLAQQISTTAARTIAGRLVRAHGTPVGGLEHLGLSRTFPGPEVLAEADLHGIGLTRSRAATVNATARAVLDGSLTFEDPPVDQLLAVRGIGPWTAGYVAMRMGAPDEFPAADLGLQEAVARINGGPRPSTSEMEAMSQRWRPYRSFAAIHLWWSLRSHG